MGGGTGISYRIIKIKRESPFQYVCDCCMVSFSFAGRSFTSVITKDGSNGGESALGPLSDCRYDNIL